jgi:hypothetical protein
LQSIEARPIRSAAAANSVKRARSAAVPVLKRKMAIMIAVAGLCAAVAGCVSDMGAPTAENSGSSQLHYSGGPKYPMWSAQ